MSPALVTRPTATASASSAAHPARIPGRWRRTSCPTTPPRRTRAISPGASRKWWRAGEPARDGGHPPGAVRGLLYPAGGAQRFSRPTRGTDARGHPGVCGLPGKPAGRAPHPPLIALLRSSTTPRRISISLPPCWGRCSASRTTTLSACGPGRPAEAPHASASTARCCTVNSGEDTPFTGVRAFYARLTELRRMARSAPAEQLLEEIFASTGYLAALGVMENGARRREDPGGLLPSAPGRAPAASRRWSGPLTLRRWQAPRAGYRARRPPAPAASP